MPHNPQFPLGFAAALGLLLSGALTPATALAASAVSCGGAAMQGGAQLQCSHVDPSKPAQFCTFSWALATIANQTQVVQGSFLLQPGTANVQVYQGSGFTHAMSGPIVMCQGKRGK